MSKRRLPESLDYSPEEEIKAARIDAELYSQIEEDSSITLHRSETPEQVSPKWCMRISPDVLHLETSRVQIEVHVYQEVQRTTPVERRMGQELLSTIDDWVHAM